MRTERRGRAQDRFERCKCGNKLYGRNKICSTCQGKIKRQKIIDNIERSASNEASYLIYEIDKDVASWCFGKLLEAVKVRSKDDDIVEYCERVINLPAGDGWKGSGKLNFEQYPIAAQMLRHFADPSCEAIFYLAGTQTGKSTFELCALNYSMTKRGGNCVYVAPSDALRKKIPSTKFIPTWKNSAEIGYVKTELGGVKHSFSGGNFIYCALATNAESLADTSAVSTGFITEHDEISPNLKHDCFSLLYDRVRFSHFPKIVCSGTPRRFDNRGMYQIYNGGKVKRFYPEVPCPHCGKYITIDDEDIQAPEGVDPKVIKKNKLAFVICKECGERITDVHHKEMMLQARLRDLDPEHHGIWRGCRAPSWYSVKYNFSSAISEKLDSMSDPIKLMDWYKSVAAKPVDTLAINKLSAGEGYELRKDAGYRREKAEIPKEVYGITAGVDVGTNGFWLVVLGWGLEGRKYVLWNSLYSPRGASTKHWEEAWSKCVQRATMAHGTYLGNNKIPRFFRGIIDSGYDAPFCYRMCKLYPQWIPAKGMSFREGLYKKAYADPENKYHGEFSRIPLLLQNTHHAHDLLESFLNTSIVDPNGIAFPIDEGKRIFNHLRGAVKKETTRGFIWDKASKDSDDHLRDALALAVIAGYTCKLNELKKIEPKKEEAKKSVKKKETIELSNSERC